jgi:hypothetical protein
MNQNNLIPEELKSYFKNISNTLELIDRCFQILNEQPDFLKVRVFLSKLYYHQGYYEFAKRELLELKKHGDFPLADRIIMHLGGGAENESKKILAEIKF